MHVWRFGLDVEKADRLLLSPDERRRADRFRLATTRNRFTAARAGLRRLLAGYLDLAPETIPFDYGPRGKPSLANGFHGPRISFNLAHSDRLALAAFTIGREVGVDLERLRRRVFEQRLAQRFFAPAEARALAAVRGADRTAAFFAVWTRKEAYLKALGHGITYRELRRFAVSSDPWTERVAIDTMDDPAAGRRWSLLNLEPAPGFAGAVAVEGPVEIHRWELR